MKMPGMSCISAMNLKTPVMKKLFSLLLISVCLSAAAQENPVAIVDGRYVELDRVVYSRNPLHDGFGYYSYNTEGKLEFFKHGFAIEFGENDGEFRRGNFVNGYLEGEGEEQLNGYRYEGEYVKSKFEGIGRLTNMKTGKSLYGYFSEGKFIRPIRSYGPYLCPCIFMTAGCASCKNADPYNGMPDPFTVSPGDKVSRQ